MRSRTKSPGDPGSYPKLPGGRMVVFGLLPARVLDAGEFVPGSWNGETGQFRSDLTGRTTRVEPLNTLPLEVALQRPAGWIWPAKFLVSDCSKRR